MLEIVIASLVLACGLIPVVSSIQSSAREARQLEAHVQALARCRGLLDAARSWGPSTFELYATKGGEVTLPLALPKDAPRTTAPAAGEASPVLARISNLKEKVTVQAARQGAGGALYLLKATVSWDALGDERRATTVELVTLVGDPLQTWKQPGALK